jgi:hypothetical protein
MKRGDEALIKSGTKDINGREFEKDTVVVVVGFETVDKRQLAVVVEKSRTGATKLDTGRYFVDFKTL